MFELKHPKNGFRLINSLLGIRKNNFFSEKKLVDPQGFVNWVKMKENGPKMRYF